jgi:uncharacterized membrane protein YukC
MIRESLKSYFPDEYITVLEMKGLNQILDFIFIKFFKKREKNNKNIALISEFTVF